jgi:propanol-preferring alcohol dehydrogenase
MRALRAHAGQSSLVSDELPVPEPGPGQVLIRVDACGVCRTDLHIVDGELTDCVHPVTPGHEIVGTVVATGAAAHLWKAGERLGVPWLAWTCGACEYCRSGRENLCGRAAFTGCTVPGGYADYAVADERYCVAIPARYDDLAAAPLLCAGLIGYRAYAMAGEGARIGLFGFGAAAHLLAQVACHDGREVFAFTRPGDLAGQAFARDLGVHWAGGSDETPPVPLDAAILFAPVGSLVPQALRLVKKGGRVICGGIHMSDIPAFPYALLWGERSVQSVANLTRADGAAFMRIAADVELRVAARPYPLTDANAALADLRSGRLEGAAVLVP